MTQGGSDPANAAITNDGGDNLLSASRKEAKPSSHSGSSYFVLKNLKVKTYY